MAYNLLYIEDLDPKSIVHELETKGFNVKHLNPSSFEESMKEISSIGCDAILIDFRLTSGAAIFDAPTIAQTLRTKNTVYHKSIPIILVSSETRISDYYKDFTSQDLFDFSTSKEWFLKNIDKCVLRINSFINAYKKIETSEYNIGSILNVSAEELKQIDYRIIERVNSEVIKTDTHAFSSFICNELIKSIGLLIGEQVLAARLGVSIKSEGWDRLKENFIAFKYNGIFSDSYNRWWAYGIENWWLTNSGTDIGLRRLNAEQRVERIKAFTGIENLRAESKLDFSKSSNFWTICKSTFRPIDPIDGLELHQRELYAWQEKEYISILAGLESTELLNFVKPIDKRKLSEIQKSL